MTAHDIAELIADQQDWSDSTLLSVVLDYIDNQDSNDAFRDYMRERAAEEKSEGDEEMPVVLSRREWYELHDFLVLHHEPQGTAQTIIDQL